MVDRLTGKSMAAHQVWLPPLTASPTLDELLPALEPAPGLGLAPVDWAGRGGLVIPVGVVDRPFEQVRDLYMVDLSGVGGHVGIVGRQQGGKSTLLRTLMTGLAVTHTPQQVQFYCIDLGGGTLAALAGLPHVGGVATRLETDLVSRTIAEVTALVTEREKMFAARGIANMTAFRQLRAAGQLSDETHGDVFLVIDGWSTFKVDFEGLEMGLRTFMPRMLNYGVHMILCTNRWSEMHSSVRDQMGTRLELRLGDPLDSIIDIRAAKNVPEQAGAGLTAGKLQFVSALPRIDGDSAVASLELGVSSLVNAVADHWDGPAAPRVRMLPDRLPADQLPPPEGKLKVALGWNEAALAPVWHDFSTTAHLTVLGDTESGKTNVLQLMARAITRCYTPEEAKIVLVDLRRELFDAVPQEFRRGYAVSSAAAGQIVTEVANELRDRASRAGHHARATAPPRLVDRSRGLPAGGRLRPGGVRGQQPARAAGRVHPAGGRHRPAHHHRPGRGGLHAHRRWTRCCGACRSPTPPTSRCPARRRKECCSATCGPASSRPAAPCC